MVIFYTWFLFCPAINSISYISIPYIMKYKLNYLIKFTASMDGWWLLRMNYSKQEKFIFLGAKLLYKRLCLSVCLSTTIYF